MQIKMCSVVQRLLCLLVSVLGFSISQALWKVDGEARFVSLFRLSRELRCHYLIYIHSSERITMAGPKDSVAKGQTNGTAGKDVR